MKTILITGANSGLGFAASQEMAGKGYRVVMAVRNKEKGEEAVQKILKKFPCAEVCLMQLDLASLESIRLFADSFAQKFDSLDILCNNAGVMVPPFQKTKDGFELQFGTNHLGHFALTALMLPFLKKSPNARIITTSSVAKWFGWIRWNSFKGGRHYSPWLYYGQSKYANYLFFKLLQDKLDKHGLKILSLGCHPGIAQTNLTARGTGQKSRFLERVWSLFGQPCENGASTLMEAITNDHLKGKDYIVPDGFMQFKGKPKVGKHLCLRYNKKVAEKLWCKSEELSQIFFTW